MLPIRTGKTYVQPEENKSHKLHNQPRLNIATADHFTPKAHELLKSEAYWNSKHPEHEKVKGLLTRSFQKDCPEE